MSTNIVVNDAQATPVSHTFVPVGEDQSKTFWFMDQSAANALGYWKIGIKIQRPPAATNRTSAEGRNYLVKISVLQPVLANISNSTVSGVAPAPTLAYTPRSYHEFILPEWSGLLDRKNMAKMAPLILQNAQVVAVLENLGWVN